MRQSCNGGDLILDEFLDFGVILDSLLGLAVDEHVHILELLNERLGLSVVLFHPRPDYVLFVILANHQFSPTVIANTFLFGQEGVHRIAIPELSL